MSQALPTILIGGWLGAGKTTLVNHVLRQADGTRVAVLVNDFGEVGIDADLIEGAEAGVLNLAGGCLCCAFGDDLVGTLAGLQRRDPRPDVVLIELSGVALPGPVAATAGLAEGVHVAGTLVLADATAVRRQANDRYVGDTVRGQLAAADWLLLSKRDQVDETTAHEVEAALSGWAPQARRWSGHARDVAPELLFGWPDRVTAGGGDGAGLDRWAARALRPAHATFASAALPVPRAVDVRALADGLADPALGLLRAKGFVHDAAGDGWLLQLAAGRCQLTPARWRGEGRLVMIGLRAGWDAGRLAALVEACVDGGVSEAGRSGPTGSRTGP